MQEIEGRVREGAKHLDVVAPGWRSIDPAEIDMENVSTDVLALAGIPALMAYDDESSRWMTERGFVLSGDDTETWEQLTEAWRAVLG